MIDSGAVGTKKRGLEPIYGRIPRHLSKKMDKIPTLTTPHLILRPFTVEDSSRVQLLAGDRAIAETTAHIPHPYKNGMAEEWISTHQASYKAKKSLILAVTVRDEFELIGAMGLEINITHQYAELGYWIGKAYWNQGFCTEAAREVVRFGFEQLGLNRIQARHMLKNPGSGRVLEKIGMKKEGVLRQALNRFGKYHDYALWAILRDEYKEMESAS
jgi:[ribosomal protein S5]-alanine N-acetyltransferase